MPEKAKAPSGAGGALGGAMSFPSTCARPGRPAEGLPVRHRALVYGTGHINTVAHRIAFVERSSRAICRTGQARAACDGIVVQPREDERAEQGFAVCQCRAGIDALRCGCGCRDADAPWHGQPAGERAICLAACLAALPLCRHQRQRVGHGGRRQHAPRDRIGDRSGDRRAAVRMARRSACRRGRSIWRPTCPRSSCWSRSTIQVHSACIVSTRMRRRATRSRSPGRSMRASSHTRFARRPTTAR